MNQEDKPAPKYKVNQTLYALRGAKIIRINVHAIYCNSSNSYQYEDNEFVQGDDGYYQLCLGTFDPIFNEDVLFPSIDELLKHVHNEAKPHQ